MKKIIASLALLLGVLHSLSAVPAYPGPIRVTQPDGSVITLRLHGDEWFHYLTDESGQAVARGADGFYRKTAKPSAEQFEEAAGLRRAAARMREQAAVKAITGQRRFLVLLVEFSDLAFTTSDDPQAAFSALLNQKGYSANGGNGSARDYFYDNSSGRFEPVFDVFGPVTLDKEKAYYGGNQNNEQAKDLRPAQAVIDGCRKLDKDVDFSQYDSDGDGEVDMVLMYYAGYGEADSGDADALWPHEWNVSASGNNLTLDGVRIDTYACSNEISGYGRWYGRMCGIGTACHEFGHALGLPDLYDTNYETDGEAGGLYGYSLMCSGSYNNDGRTPPYLTSEERKLLGWMEDQTEIMAAGPLSLSPLQENVAYRTPATMDGEYFVYECRTQTGWDAYVPGAGLVVYHVDKSERSPLKSAGWYSSYYTPVNLWKYWKMTNAINAIGSHPCYYVVPAAAPSSLNYTGSGAGIPFPGVRRVKTYTPVDWQESVTDFRFSDIAYDGSRVTMTVHFTTVPGVSGIVRNTTAKPVRGATVTLYKEGTALMSATTETDGSFSLEDESLAHGDFLLKAACEGYVEAGVSVHIDRKMTTCDFYLRKVGEPVEGTFIKYDPEGSSFRSFGYGNAAYNQSAGIRLSAEEAAANAGKQIKLISFQPFGEASATAEAAYVFIEVGETRVFTQKVEGLRFDAMNTVNVVGQEFYVPAGSEIYIGYGLVKCSEPSPLLVQACDEEHAGVYARFNQTRANNWSVMQEGDGVFYTPVLSAAVGEPVQPELGFNHIANPGNGAYKAGDRFELALVKYEDDPYASLSWTFDGQSVPGGSVTLSAGSHTIEAHLTYPDGSSEVIRLVLQAE